MSDIRVLGNVMVPMRDGVMLATDVYLPSFSAQASWPVIMERTPYDKTGPSRSEVSLRDPGPRSRVAVARAFAELGFAVVMQDCRGRYGSGGVFTKYLNEAEDGFDTLLWLMQQTWCDGRVGTMGVSYGAHTQSALACLDPPGLACMFMDSGGFSSAFHGGIRRGGAYELKQATWAYRHALLSPQAAADPGLLEALQREDVAEWFRLMPWYPGHSPLRHSPEYESYLFELWQHGTFDEYWQRPGLYAEGFYDVFPDVPVAIVGSWYDPYVRTCLSNFAGLAARKQSAMLLVMGPWTHGDRSSTYSGNVDFGAGSTLDGNVAEDYFAMRLAWFQRWLPARDSATCTPGDTGGCAPLRDIRYFRMGGGSGCSDAQGRLQHGGEWCRSGQWPPVSVSPRQYYLGVDGSLRDVAQQETEGVSPFLEFVFDPRDPVPTVGGALTSGDPVMQGGAFDQRSCAGKFGFDDSSESVALAARDDVLVFQTDELADDVVITGTIEVELWISSDQPDTDFTVKLIDVYPPSEDYPDGYAMNITDGIFRVRYRHGFDREVMMAPGEICKITIEPFATSNRFCKGHRLRIDVSSSNFPHFDVNPNTGAPQGQAGVSRVARNRVYCGARYASALRVGVESP